MYVGNLGYGRRRRRHGDIFLYVVRDRDTEDNFDLFHGLYKHNQNRKYAYMESYGHNRQSVGRICRMYDKPTISILFFENYFFMFYLCGLDFTNKIDFDISIIENETFSHSKWSLH